MLYIGRAFAFNVWLFFQPPYQKVRSLYIGLWSNIPGQWIKS
jgi:hypothetical protein